MTICRYCARCGSSWRPRSASSSLARMSAAGLRGTASERIVRAGCHEMVEASRLAFLKRRRSGDPKASRRPEALRVELDRPTCAAGDAVSGLVAGPADCATVALVRVERDPDRYRLIQIDEGKTSPQQRTFQLTLPCTALPSVRGESCALAYLVRARSRDGVASAELVVVAAAHPHIDTDSWRTDRLLANWDARHFHIELVEAHLQGGGRIAGRVHRHRSWRPGAIDVTARCLECWRCYVLAGPSPPQWRTCPRWEQAHRLRIDPDATWAPFAFELPDGLPPAVEASTIAWRYELHARRNVPHWFSETAAVTPLLHEHARAIDSAAEN